MLLITSGEYLDSELFAEFGKIPPAFLPVGNRRLYAYQIEQHARHHEQVHMTVPDGFELDEADQVWLARHGVQLYPTTPGLPLGAALHAFLLERDLAGPIDILYGDTLITDEHGGGSDWLAVGHTDAYYHWHHEAPRGSEPGGTWTGMFSFADAQRLRESVRRHSDFIAAVDDYGVAIGGLRHRVVERWYDFGHIHTYYDSKRVITTQRHFNELQVADGVVTKSSSDAAKMDAEAAWFESAPAPVKPYLAPYIGRKAGPPAGYQLEYLHLATLSELYVFGRLPERVWRKIFASCDAYLRCAGALAVAAPPAADCARQTYLGKTISRLSTYAGQSGCDLDAGWRLNGVAAPSLAAIAHEAADAVLAQPLAAAFVHGDFCFSNIMFDFRAGRLKMIDPRGADAHGRPTCYGDLRYEIGKLAHSVLGLYDFIVAGSFQHSAEGQDISFRVLAERCAPVQHAFAGASFAGRRPAQWDCYPVMVLLFLSMLPLHADSPLRQQALMANGIRLYLEWKSHDRHSDGGTEPPLL